MPVPAEGVPMSLRERKKARTRDAIQTHGLRLFREQGYDATTIEQIITAAEVSETTFFRYFPTKEDVVLRDDLDPLLAQALRSQPADLPPLRAVRAAFRTHFDAFSPEQRQESRERISLIVAVPALRAAMLDQFSQAMQLLADAVADRVGRPRDDLAVRTVAGAVVGAVLAVLAAMADDPSTDLGDLLDEALGHVENGFSLG